MRSLLEPRMNGTTDMSYLMDDAMNDVNASTRRHVDESVDFVQPAFEQAYNLDEDKLNKLRSYWIAGPITKPAFVRALSKILDGEPIVSDGTILKRYMMLFDEIDVNNSGYVIFIITMTFSVVEWESFFSYITEDAVIDTATSTCRYVPVPHTMTFGPDDVVERVFYLERANRFLLCQRNSVCVTCHKR